MVRYYWYFWLAGIFQGEKTSATTDQTFFFQPNRKLSLSQNFLVTHWSNFSAIAYMYLAVRTQCPRTDLKKRFLPKLMTTTR